MSAVSVSEPGVRPLLADAVDVARRALLELEPSAVGTHLGVSAEDESAATHRFEATLPGYRGWQWAVVVAAPPGADHVTVSESALLPGPDALVAPDFVPWDQRVRPGDLAPGDLLAPIPNDPRLVPGYVATGDPVVDEVAYEVGLGRTQVLSLEGRAEAADRWYAELGPDTDMAKAAPSTCGLCGFYLPLAGALRAAFGVCANSMGADGRVVHNEYGCGAHSDVEAPTGGGSPLYEAFDDAAYDVIPAEALKKPQQAASDSSAEATAVPEATAAPAASEATVEPAAEVESHAAVAPGVEAVATAETEALEPGVEAVAPAALASEPAADSTESATAVESEAAAEPGAEASKASSKNGVAQANSVAGAEATDPAASELEAEATSTVVSVRPKADVAVRADASESESGAEESVTYVADSKGEVVAGGEAGESAESAPQESVTYVADSTGEVAVAEQVEMLGDAAVEGSESESSRN
ncbi:DUF3027 domain-containing protein [Nocardia sp. XZ_19_385]|uniref:DUF3027 domain-containing protein n=1 Tax=Nocardia sp. XZ_19_385 TaxID=2769488 RepID=UPI0028164088|nr:DUF3027 domain-containing protein [Nocardia sp. XZ_19_385]